MAFLPAIFYLGKTPNTSNIWQKEHACSLFQMNRRPSKLLFQCNVYVGLDVPVNAYPFWSFTESKKDKNVTDRWLADNPYIDSLKCSWFHMHKKACKSRRFLMLEASTNVSMMCVSRSTPGLFFSKIIFNDFRHCLKS